MATQPLPCYTPRELECGRRIAAALWCLTAALLALLAVWSSGPHGLG